MPVPNVIDVAPLQCVDVANTQPCEARETESPLSVGYTRTFLVRRHEQLKLVGSKLGRCRKHRLGEDVAFIELVERVYGDYAAPLCLVEYRH